MLAKNLQAAAGNAVPTDPQFPYVTLLLHGDGTNGAQNNTFLDSSTNNFTITRNGNTTQGSFSPYGDNWSNYFDGTGDYLNCDQALDGLTSASNPFTVECWFFSPVMPTGGDSNFQTIIGINGSTYANIVGLAIVDNKLYLHYAGASAYIPSTPVVNSGTWYHIAAVFDGTNYKVYLNGALAQTVASNPSVALSTCFLNIGMEIDPGPSYGNYFNGYISNVRVTNSAVYTSDFTPPTAPLTAIAGTSLLTCQSNRFKDASANNFTITRTGDVSVQRFSPFAPTAEYSASVIGGSGYFDGTGDYLSTPATGQFTASGNFTVSCWFYLNSFAASYYVVGGNWSATTSDEWLIQVQNNGAIRFLTSAGTAFSSAGVVKLKEWTFFSATRTGTTVTVQVNGSTVSTYTKSDTLGAANKAVTIGWQPGGSWPWNGYIADFRLVSGSAVSSIPTIPLTAIAGTSLLLSMTNAGIYDNAMMADLETVGNAQVSTSVKKFGTGSMRFDGNGDYLKVPNGVNKTLAFDTGNFTIECWLYLNTVSGDQVITDFRAVNDARTTAFSFSTSGTALKVYINGDRPLGGTLATGIWYHIALVRNGTGSNNLTAYINGTATGTTATLTENLTDTSINIGAVAGGGVAQLNGYIDDLRITKGYARYTANFTPPTAAFPNQ